MYIYIYIYIYILYLFIYLFIYLFVYLFIYLFNKYQIYLTYHRYLTNISIFSISYDYSLFFVNIYLF